MFHSERFAWYKVKRAVGPDVIGTCSPFCLGSFPADSSQAAGQTHNFPGRMEIIFRILCFLSPVLALLPPEAGLLPP